FILVLAAAAAAAAAVSACKMNDTPPEPEPKPPATSAPIPTAAPGAALNTALGGGTAAGGTATGAGVHEKGNGDPLDGSFTMADATKNLPGTGPLVATIETSLGNLSCRLFDDKAP